MSPIIQLVKVSHKLIRIYLKHGVNLAYVVSVFEPLLVLLTVDRNDENVVQIYMGSI